MEQTSTFPWLIKCAGAAAVLLLACGLATAHFGAALQQPTVTTRDGTLVTLNRYVSEPTPDLVLVGSSVAWRLKEEYFSRPGVRNLALAGGSPVTSLDIIAKQKSLPKIVLIETNVLTRLADEALIGKFKGGAGNEPLFLRPVRTAVAAYETWNHTPPNPAEARAGRDRLLGEPPSNFNNKVYLDRAVGQMNAEDPTAATRVNVARMGALIDDIERRDRAPSCSRFRSRPRSRTRDMSRRARRSSTPPSRIRDAGCGSTRRAASCAGPTASISTSARPCWSCAPSRAPWPSAASNGYTAAVVTPPSMTMVWPVMKLEASEAR